MSDNLLDEIIEYFEIKQDTKIEFKQLHNLTFAFLKTIHIINDSVTSAEIKALGIIYKENDEYYFAPLDEVSEVEGIVKEFVKKYLKK